ncbi:ABC transporter ATP-binding protein [Frondihabitans australicus]|uniref:Peptide/nickel transport system ATP-binding protein n=1 Tax=Frondihabitans australicus TaxID=386892 RepID=A0A495IIR4_9MICO|nr:ABC transporter ATP-binding protein [Frondihabitans australicus]RKR75883.1 peptide/nickel transport system ATP-binding protein [Frondihabitans australicus]
MSADSILEVDGFSGGFENRPGVIDAVLEHVSFAVPTGSSTAIVGESGSGKSLTALAVMGLAPSRFRRTAGSIRLGGRDLTSTSEHELRRVRGREVGMVFQDARSALNPVFTVGHQLADVCRAHRGVSRREALREAEHMLDRVRVPEAARRMQQYPHEFSGGMAQRAMLAMALISRPRLLILDEPTTGLDVTIQADVLDLIIDIKAETGMTTCLITHDLGVVAETCDRVVVMRGGEVREIGSCEQIISAPTDPYTRQLIDDSRMVETR